jgi:ankyrin repeat protein
MSNMFRQGGDMKKHLLLITCLGVVVGTPAHGQMQQSVKIDSCPAQEVVTKGMEVTLPPLLLAALDRNVGKTKMLLSKGAEVDARAADGGTALTYLLDFRISEPTDSAQQRAARDERKVQPLMALLLKSRANPNLADKKGMTPLLMVVRSKANKPLGLTLAQQLITTGAQVNATNNYGLTPLMMAASAGDARMAALLLHNTADRSLRDCRGRLAADIAVANGHKELATTLKP